MKLEQITTAVRPRSPWEAMDLGFHLARRWWRAILVPWLLVVAGFAAAIFYLLKDWPQLAMLVFWLFKPLYDRVPLYVLSRALFNAAPSWGETIGAIPGLLTKDLPWAILHRFSLIRSFSLPVRELEGLRGKDSRERLHLLQRNVRGHATGLTILFLGLESVIMLSLFWLIPLLLPQEVNEQLLQQAFITASATEIMPWVMSGLYVLTVVMLEPLYVATGFMLYLNRRTILEAWDVELSFRRMSKRLAGVVPALLLACLILGSGLPQQAQANSPVPPELWPREEAKAIIKEVLATPEFETYIEIQQLQFIDEDEEEDLDFEGFDLELGAFLARLTEIIIWVLLGVSIILLYVHRQKWLRIFRPEQPAPQTAAPETLCGLDIRPESLPDDVAGAALALWHEGNQRKAMSLLYRGALAALVHQQGVAFSSSHTENDCLHILQPLASPGQYHHFQTLTHAWQQTAYAHRPPAEAQLISLCDCWNEYYEVT